MVPSTYRVASEQLRSLEQLHVEVGVSRQVVQAAGVEKGAHLVEQPPGVALRVDGRLVALFAAYAPIGEVRAAAVWRHELAAAVCAGESRFVDLW